MTPGRPATILFDWDNTLVENWRSVQAALNATRAVFSMAPLTLEETLANAKLSARDSFPRMFGADWQTARARFNEEFERRHLDGLVALSGAAVLLRAAQARGIAMALVSNKQGRFLRREAAHLGWQSFFGATIGAGDAARDKPDPAPALAALTALGRESGADCWFVGDTDVDIACGTAAGCATILIATTGPLGALSPECPTPATRVADLDALLRLVEGR